MEGSIRVTGYTEGSGDQRRKPPTLPWGLGEGLIEERKLSWALEAEKKPMPTVVF